MQTPQPPVAAHPSRRWGRLASWSRQPARLAHRGAPLPDKARWDKAWRPCLAYGADSLVTAAVRPFSGVFIGARDGWAALEGQPGRKRALKSAEGAAAGLGKGLVGCAVSAGGACVFLATGVGLGGAAGFRKLAAARPGAKAHAPTKPVA